MYEGTCKLLGEAMMTGLTCVLLSVGAGPYHQSDGACGRVSGVGFNRTATGEQRNVNRPPVKVLSLCTRPSCLQIHSRQDHEKKNLFLYSFFFYSETKETHLLF